MSQQQPLGYRGRSALHDDLVESQRKARWCFVTASLLSAIGLLVLAIALAVAAHYPPFDIGGSRRTGRFAGSIMLLSFIVFGGAIERFNAGFYHRSGFEHRHKIK